MNRLTSPAADRTHPGVTDRRLLAASVAVSLLAPVVWPALIGAVALVIWVSVRLARRRHRSVAILTTAIVLLSLSIAIAVALGWVTAATVSDTGDGAVTLTPG